MTPDKILEIARRFDPDEPDFVMTEDTLIDFAQAIIEAERESSEAPVAWMDTSGRIKGIPANIGSNECAPLYRRPPPTRKLTDDEIEELYMQMIERRINGEEE